MSKGYRGRGKRDSNHADMAAAFGSLGCTVLDLADVGDGCPDLLVGVVGVNLLVEVKTDVGKYTPAQTLFNDVWRGQRATVRTPDDCIDLVMMVRKSLKKS